MADVTLRESVDLLRSHLRAGQYSDAYALGRHILQYYPKHIETYTILGQVCLATGDTRGANDLLRRALSADPENVIALAGMALISETQDKQDEALWYLERAYEIQPSNDELRGQLLRLREQYYGTAMMRVELTPGALARVYARQGQYVQAVNEYRRLLRDETRRYDARVGLAETLYRAGRTDEAARVAQSVMADAPYALKANLILGALWTENAVPEGQQFLQRAHQMDPEHRVARDLLGERFNGGESPRLPRMGETAAGPVEQTTLSQAPVGSGSLSDQETARAALVLSEIDRAQVLENSDRQVLVADPEALKRLEAEPMQVRVGKSARLANRSGAAGATGALAAQEIDTTLKEIAEAQRKAEQHAAAAVDNAGQGNTQKGLTETIAAAAAALASSIALDKTKQPAPTRRTHSAIPKVRPVISGHKDKLPAWLYLSATSGTPSTLFDSPTPDSPEKVAPLTNGSDRPDWLVQAEAARESEPVSVGTDDSLPDWLKPAAFVGSSAAVVSETNQPSDLAFRAASDELPPKPVAPVESALLPTSAILPAWLEEPTPKTESPAERAGTTDLYAVKPASPETADAASFAAPAAPAQPVPDSATMLQMARDKRVSGDLKGALELYERVMHRRPNYLEQVTADLEVIVKAGGVPLSANRLLGEAYAMVGRFRESLEQYRIAMGK